MTAPTEEIRIEYIPLEDAVLWDRNPKQHDIQLLVESIERYGFQDPPKYDAVLGAFVYGNGRTTALKWMYAQGRSCPMGVRVNGDGWEIPVKFGVDLGTKQEAEAFAVDHNVLTMAGGDFTQLDLARMWDTAGYLGLLQEMAENEVLPVTVDGDGVDMLLREIGGLIDPILPETSMQLEPTLLNDHLVVIHCSKDDLTAFEPILLEWAEYDGVTINVS